MGVEGLAIKTYYHAHLADKGMLQGGSPSSRRARDWDPEADAALWDEHTDSYFEAFPEQLEAIHAGIQVTDGAEGVALYKRQVSGCASSGSGSGSSGNSTSTPTLRQGIEFLSWPGVPAGQTWSYSWRSYQSVDTNTTDSFFHSWQLLRRDACTGPIIGSDLERDANGTSKYAIADYVTARRCTGTGACPSLDLSEVVGKTLQHSVRVKYGLSGTFTYTAVDVANASTPLISYSATGDMGASGSLKHGLYRKVVPGINTVDGYVGDYSAVRLG